MNKKENPIPREEENDPFSQQDKNHPDTEDVAESYPSFSEMVEPPLSEPEDNAPKVEKPSGPSPEEQKIETLQNQLDQAKDQMMRALADAENSRKRAQKESENASRYAISGFAKDLLSVADNLRRALDAIPPEMLEEQPQIKNLTDGIEATERELLRCFEKNGIKKILPMDQPFDPNFHEVMFEAPMPGKTPGTVIQIIEAGYTLNDRILRPARVGVAKDDGNPPPPKPDNGTGHMIDTEA